MDGAGRRLGGAVSGADREATLQPLERATMLPPAAFLEGNVLDWELENIFMGGWICVGHVSAVAEPGAYIARELAGRSFFVVGGEDGAPRAFHNVCRHRAAPSARTTPGPTTSPATSAPPLTWTGSRASTPPVTACGRSAPR